MLILPYDVETTGFPLWKEPSDHPDQPHIVQMAAKLIDADTRQTMQSIDLIIRPDGWTIPDEVTEIHGITTEHALAVGVDESTAVSLLHGLSMIADKRIAHNESFDARMIRIALKRFYGVGAADTWKEKQTECTMRLSTPICNIRQAGKKTPKWPKLEEAYEFFTGQAMENAHSAMADVEACIAVYFAMQDITDDLDEITGGAA